MRPTCLCALTVAAIAGSASAQTELIIRVEQDRLYRGRITAELINPTSPLIAAVSDLSFTLSGTNITSFVHNPAFDSDFFGPASVSITPNTVEFSGQNTLPPLSNAGGVDSSNPLLIANIEALFIWNIQINGQMTGAYDNAPFVNVFFYQNADGTAGSVPYSVLIDVAWMPTPGTATLIGMGGIIGLRRRR